MGREPRGLQEVDAHPTASQKAQLDSSRAVGFSLCIELESGYARAVPITQQCSGSPTDTHTLLPKDLFCFHRGSASASFLACRQVHYASELLLLHTAGTKIDCCRFPYGERTHSAIIACLVASGQHSASCSAVWRSSCLVASGFASNE